MSLSGKVDFLENSWFNDSKNQKPEHKVEALKSNVAAHIIDMPDIWIYWVTKAPWQRSNLDYDFASRVELDTISQGVGRYEFEPPVQTIAYSLEWRS